MRVGFRPESGFELLTEFWGCQHFFKSFSQETETKMGKMKTEKWGFNNMEKLEWFMGNLLPCRNKLKRKTSFDCCGDKIVHKRCAMYNLYNFYLILFIIRAMKKDTGPIVDPPQPLFFEIVAPIQRVYHSICVFYFS